MDCGASAVRKRFAWLVALMGASAVAASAPAVARAGLFYSGYLRQDTPIECWNDWGDGCTQSGFNYWYAVILTKYNGGRVALGMRGVGGTFYYFTYGSGANGGTYTLTKYDLSAPGYNRGFCAWYSGSDSDVDCEISL